jgi:restriction endonuclease Mrr
MRATEADMETLQSGRDTRWLNYAIWERFRMVKKGLLKPKSQSGVWEITDDGRAYLKSNKS